MKIIVDTREKPQAITDILRYFEMNGVEYEIKKLDTADYFNPENPVVLVDRKQSLYEVIGNLGNKKSRFYKECQRANKEWKQLVVLVEHGEGIKSLEDVAKWKNRNFSKKRLYIDGRELAERMHKVAVMYNVKWQFCNKPDTGKVILELLSRC